MSQEISFFCDEINVETFNDCSKVKVTCKNVSVSSFLEFVEDNGNEILKMVDVEDIADYLEGLSNKELSKFGLIKE